MKSLDQIKNEYALSKNLKSWENFCFVANDNMFVMAVDEIATLYADYCAKFLLGPRQLIMAQSAELSPIERFG